MFALPVAKTWKKVKSDDKISCMQVCKGFRGGRIILLVFLILLSKPEPDEQHTKTEAHNLKPARC